MRTRSSRVRAKLKLFMPDASDEQIYGQFVRLLRMAKTVGVLDLVVTRELEYGRTDLEKLKDMIERVVRHLGKKNKPPVQKQTNIYSIVWRIVDGAVKDAFNQHPDYLTDKGRSTARASVVKRVTGSVESFVKAKGHQANK